MEAHELDRRAWLAQRTPRERLVTFGDFRVAGEEDEYAPLWFDPLGHVREAREELILDMPHEQPLEEGEERRVQLGRTVRSRRLIDRCGRRAARQMGMACDASGEWGA